MVKLRLSPVAALSLNLPAAPVVGVFSGHGCEDAGRPSAAATLPQKPDSCGSSVWQPRASARPLATAGRGKAKVDVRPEQRGEPGRLNTRRSGAWYETPPDRPRRNTSRLSPVNIVHAITRSQAGSPVALKPKSITAHVLRPAPVDYRKRCRRAPKAARSPTLKKAPLSRPFRQELYRTVLRVPPAPCACPRPRPRAGRRDGNCLKEEGHRHNRCGEAPKETLPAQARNRSGQPSHLPSKGCPPASGRQTGTKGSRHPVRPWPRARGWAEQMSRKLRQPAVLLDHLSGTRRWKAEPAWCRRGGRCDCPIRPVRQPQPKSWTSEETGRLSAGGPARR